jgi:hypothetical protein
MSFPPSRWLPVRLPELQIFVSKGPTTMTKTQSFQMMEAANQVARWMRDCGDFDGPTVVKAEQVAAAIEAEREDMGF